MKSNIFALLIIAAAVAPVFHIPRESAITPAPSLDNQLEKINGLLDQLNADIEDANDADEIIGYLTEVEPFSRYPPIKFEAKMVMTDSGRKIVVEAVLANRFRKVLSPVDLEMLALRCGE